MKPGTHVIVYGGPHHERSGVVVERETTHEFDLPGFSLVNFNGKKGFPLKRCDSQGRAPFDLVRDERLCVFDEPV